MARPHLRAAEIRESLDQQGLAYTYRPVLTVAEAADLLRVSPKTIYYWIQQGRLDGCLRRRGKHHLIWRDRLVRCIFDGPDWAQRR